MRAERRHEEAVSIYRKIVSLEPDRADWKFNLALALEGLGQKTGIAPFHLISMTTSRSDELEAGRRDAKMYTVVSRCPSL